MKNRLKSIALALAVMLTVPAAAQAGDWGHGRGHGHGHHGKHWKKHDRGWGHVSYHSGPRFFAPHRRNYVYYQTPPAPVYYQPYYVQPRPVYVAPQPVYYPSSSLSIGLNFR